MNNRIFVSSTFEDLINHRRAVDAALHSLGMNTLDVVEINTKLSDIVETSYTALKMADGFVGVYASHYGDILEGYGQSLTELVYDEAVRLDKPRFVYMVDPRELWPTDYLQSDQRGAMMRMFIDKLKKDKDVLRYFTTPEDLAEKLTFDMARFKVADPKRAELNRGRVVVGILSLLVILLLIVFAVVMIAN